MKLLSLKPANDNIHKYVATILQDNGRTRQIKFGAFGMSDFTKHRDEERKQRYLDRHRAREDWTKQGVLTSGFWSRHILWNKPTLSESLRDVKERFDL